MDSSSSFLIMVAVPLALALVMFGLGLGLTAEDFRRVAKYPKATLIGLLAKAILMPATGFALAFAFGLSVPFAIGLAMTSAGPASVMANLYTRLANGNVALGLTFTAIDNLLGAAILPAITMIAAWVFAGRSEHVALQIIDSVRIFLLIAIPVGFGLLMRARFPVISAKLEKVLRTFGILLMVALIAIIAIKEREHIMQTVGSLVGPTILLSFLGLVYGALLTPLLGFSRKDAAAIGFALPMQGTAVVATVALTVFTDFEYAMPAGIYSLAMYPISFLAIWWFKD